MKASLDLVIGSSVVCETAGIDPCTFAEGTVYLRLNGDIRSNVVSIDAPVSSEDPAVIQIIILTPLTIRSEVPSSRLEMHVEIQESPCSRNEPTTLKCVYQTDTQIVAITTGIYIKDTGTASCDLP